MKYTKNQVLHIVDRCFKKWCSDYRNEAEETALEELGEFIVEPPTLRPMSGVKFGSAVFLLESNMKINSWQDGYFSDDKFKGAVILDQGGSFDKDKDFKGIYGQIKGWLPSLPNPNEIKLPC